MNNIPQLHHGIINVGDLPIPFNMVLNAAVLTIVLTFIFLKVSWKESILTSKETLFPTKQSTSGKLFGLFILSLLTVPGLMNNESATVYNTFGIVGISMDWGSSSWLIFWRLVCKI